MRKDLSNCKPVPVPYELLFVSTRTRYLPPSFLLLAFRFSQIACWPGSSCSDGEAHHSWRLSEAALPSQKFYVVCFYESGAGKYCFWIHDCDFCLFLIFKFAVIATYHFTTLQVFHCHFNSNFFPLFLEHLLSDRISASTGSFLLGKSM